MYLERHVRIALMLGLFGRFGRSRDLRVLDQEMKSAGVHPAMVSDAVKLTIIRLLNAAHGTAAPHFAEAAALVAYCVLGPETFGDINGSDHAKTVEHRLHRAIVDESSLDAQMILLTMHAHLIRPDVVERYGLNVEE